jgi:hypothetical protein
MSPITEAGGFGPVKGSETPGGCSPSLLVISPDRAGATRALRRVAARVARVVADGRELTEEELERASDEDEDVWNVNYVSEPEQMVRGVAIDVDFKSEDLTPRMGETYRAIAREELEREGVTDARLSVPDTLDRDTAGEGMFASAGVRSIELREAAPLDRVLRALFARLPSGAMMIVGSPYGAPAVCEFLAEHDCRETSPLGFLSDHPGMRLDPETVRGFWSAAAVPHDRPFELVGRPLWFLDGERVVAYAPAARDGVLRVRADADPALIGALESEVGAERKAPYREWLVEVDLGKRLSRAKPRLQPEEGDWWDAAWRVWEPVPDPPSEPPAPVGPVETAARIRKSVVRLTTRYDKVWHCRRAPLGPAIGAEEASAVLSASYADWQRLTVKELVLAVARYSGGRLSVAQASKLVWYGQFPNATRLAALVAVGGPNAAVEAVLGLGGNYYRAEMVQGFRAAVVPHLSRAEREALVERVRTQCDETPWREGRFAPHAAHVLAGQLGLHEQCAQTLAENPDVLTSSERHLIVHGLGSRDEVVEAHRRLPQRFDVGWQVSAWLAVTGIDGVAEAFEGVQPQHAFALSRLAPLLRIRDPALEPHMRALLGTPVDAHARRWLEAN